jgi:hypothetical protein
MDRNYTASNIQEWNVECYIVCFVNGTIMSIQYFALNVNSGLVYAVGEILAVTADCFLNEKSGHHILKVTNTNNHSLGV